MLISLSVVSYSIQSTNRKHSLRQYVDRISALEAYKLVFKTTFYASLNNRWGKNEVAFIKFVRTFIRLKIHMYRY